MKPVTEIEVKEASIFDRRLLHKNEKNEVFLSFCNICSPNEYYAQAFLHEHHYYNDHARPLTDLMKLLECARQAETYIVNTYEKQPLDTRFVLTGWTCSLTGDVIINSGILNHSVSLKIATSNTRRVKERLLSQSYDIDIYKEETHIANVFMSVKYMTENAYCIIRKGKFKCKPSKSIMDSVKKVKINPAMVFRRNKNNVVVNEPVFDNDRVTSKLDVNMANTAYFDHVQDHYPAMVLMEAGKQNCQLWIYEFQMGVFPVLIKMESNFSLYAEIDKDIEIISVKRRDVLDNTVVFDVNLRQGGVDIAEMQYLFKVFCC